jgi:LmbE family N-acetylglucosaminyl deacetylase
MKKRIFALSLIFLFFLSVTIFAVMEVSNPSSNEEAPNVTVNATPAKVAVILPHPDDETIGMGGTIQMLMDQGSTVHCELMTSGNAVGSQLRNVTNYYNLNISSNSSESYRKKVIREDSFKRVMAVYGCQYNIEGYDDGSLNSDIVFAAMENLYLKEGYTEFYTVTGDVNGDHLACYQAMIKMKEKYPQLKYREFPIYWYRSSTPEPMAIGNNYTDINVNKYISKKEKAFQVYYNINTILPSFYPYSSGAISASPERIYYIN